MHPAPTVITSSTTSPSSPAGMQPGGRDVAVIFRTWRDAEPFRRRVRKAIKLTQDPLLSAGPTIAYTTFHSAKGLEFDVVIIPDCNHVKYRSGDAGVVELLYVGITRAARELVLTHTGETSDILPPDLPRRRAG